jgi:hypothetical protein
MNITIHFQNQPVFMIPIQSAFETGKGYSPAGRRFDEVLSALLGFWHLPRASHVGLGHCGGNQSAACDGGLEKNLQFNAVARK